MQAIRDFSEGHYKVIALGYLIIVKVACAIVLTPHVMNAKVDIFLSNTANSHCF